MELEDNKSNSQQKLSYADKQLINCTLKTKQELYAAYMPFVKNGAIFVATPREFHLGDEIYLLLTLMDEVEQYTIFGKIIWITPIGAQAGMHAGVGVQFLTEEAREVRKRIETYLAGMTNSELRTDTM